MHTPVYGRLATGQYCNTGEIRDHNGLLSMAGVLPW